MSARARPACPECAAAVAPGARRCAHCGFEFYGGARRRSAALVAGALALAAVLAVAVLALMGGDDGSATPPSLPAGEAGRRIAQELRAGGAPPGRAVCPGRVAPASRTRCRFFARDGTAQLFVVSLRRNGELLLEVPYPARRGG